jgi:alpha-1,6-mannosyltransferase
MMLALVNGIALCYFRRVVARRFGKSTSLYFTLLSVSQYHIPFWAGRTIPNMFAFAPVAIAMAQLFDRSIVYVKTQKRVVTLLAFSGVVLRGELALLLAPVTLYAIFRRRGFSVDVVRRLVWASFFSAGML